MPGREDDFCPQKPKYGFLSIIWLPTTVQILTRTQFQKKWEIVPILLSDYYLYNIY